ncbi:MAG: peptidyl-prolyl cis-trans isomerase [Acidobacteriota bacterium]|jgi:peptidyl-prolyl cis-trans isomerase D
MLNTMRENLKALSWLLWLTVASFVIAIFVDWGRAGDAARGGAGANWVARVNGESVSVAEFADVLRELDRRYRQIFQDQYDPETLGIVQLALSQVVQDRLIVDEAQRRGLKVAPEEVSRSITRNPSFQEGGVFIGTSAYVKFLRDRGIDVEQFERDIARGLLREKFQRAVTDGVTISPEEVEADYRRRNEKATVDYVVLEADAFRSDEPAPAEDLRAYYDAHRDNYLSPERRRASYVVINPDQLSDVPGVTEEDARAYYEDNLATQYSTPEQVRASHILIRVPEDATAEQEEAAAKRARELLARIRSGEDFAKLAEEYSEDETNASLGGDLGFFPRDRMVPAFSEAAFGLAMNQVSEPVRTQFGFHIIKLTGRREASTRPFAEVRDPIMRQLQFSRGQEALRDTVASFRSAVEADAGEFDRAAARLGLEVKDTGMVERGGPIDDLGDFPQLTQALFSTEIGTMSRGVALPQGTLFLRVNEVLPPQPLPFEEAADDVEQDYLLDRSLRAARERAESTGATDLAGLARALGQEVQSAAAFTRAEAPDVFPPDAIEAAFRQPEGELSPAFDVEDGILFLEVAKREGFDPAAFAEQRPFLERSLLQQRRNRAFSAVLSRLESASRVEVNEARLALYQGRGA